MNKYIRNVKQINIFIRRTNLNITRMSCYGTRKHKYKVKRFRQILKAYSLKLKR